PGSRVVRLHAWMFSGQELGRKRRPPVAGIGRGCRARRMRAWSEPGEDALSIWLGTWGAREAERHQLFGDWSARTTRQHAGRRPGQFRRHALDDRLESLWAHLAEPVDSRAGAGSGQL